MAAAEARAAWQRAANRYFVQEDAKRAPKLACCQSSNSSSKQADSGLANVIDAPDRVVSHFPFNRTPSYSKLPPDAKWWLHKQPNQGLQRGVNLQPQLYSRTTDFSSSVNMNEDSPVNESVTLSEESIEAVIYKDMESFLDVKKPCESGLEEFSVFDSKKVDQDFLDVKNMTDYYEFLEMEMEMVGSSICRKSSEFSSNADSSWIGGEKVPRWRVADGEELASYVAQKSFNHVENCDLPPPQKMHVSSEPYKQAKPVDHDEINMSSLDWETRSDAISSHPLGVQQRNWSFAQGLSQNEDRASEPARTNSDLLEKDRISNNDPSRAKLLEALCHSQTRARKAENAAKQAYSEKDHILKLFFRQASQLFAYKQWFKILQLENLLLQAEDDSSPLIGIPDILPWMTHEPRRKLRRNWQKSIKGKQRRSDAAENDIGKYAVALAVGFTLVSAGLILGWTVGWLLPAF